MSQREFDAWLHSNSFTAQEAAALAMGDEPSSPPPKQAEPILRRMRESYELAVDVQKRRFSPEKGLAENQASPMEPSTFKSKAMVVRTNINDPEFNCKKTWKWLTDNSENDDERSISRFDVQYFDRDEIARWLSAVGIDSEVPFDQDKLEAYKTQQSKLYDASKTPNRTALMDAVEEASARFWGSNVRAEDSDTHPTNKMVENWLIDKHNTSAAMASKIASIVRPSWAHKGAPATPTK